MTEEKKAKRAYTRKPKVEPLAVYSVAVKVTRGRKVETIYAESTRVENGCLVIVSMDGPQPLVEKTRYIPFGSAEIEVCQRPQSQFRYGAQPIDYGPVQVPGRGFAVTTAGPAPMFSHTEIGPRIELGPLEMARQMGQANPAPVVRQRPAAMVERNHEGLPVVTGGFTDSGGNF
jgi:hypothetical protein